MDKKKYVSPQYELLKFDSSIAASATSGCYEAVVSVVYHGDNTCETSGKTNTMWTDDPGW